MYWALCGGGGGGGFAVASTRAVGLSGSFGGGGGTPPLELDCTKFFGLGIGSSTNPSDFIGWQQKTDGYLYSVVRRNNAEILSDQVDYGAIGNVQNQYEVAIYGDRIFFNTGLNIFTPDFQAEAFDAYAFPMRLIASAENSAAQAGSPLLAISRIAIVQTQNSAILEYSAETALTTADTATPARWVASCREIVFTVVVATIGTNVVVRYEGTINGLAWFNLDAANADTTFTANGTYAASLSTVNLLAARVRLVSISTGSPTVTAQIRASA
jgi:hypothetical protein